MRETEALLLAIALTLVAAGCALWLALSLA